MAIENVIWDMDDEPEGNVQHVAEHGLSKEDIEEVLFGVHELDTSRSSGRPIALGFNSAGEYICVVFDWVDDNTVYPVTAYVLEDRGSPIMGKRIIRDRPLTDDEKATYREVRRQVAEELPDIRRRAKAAKPRIKLKQLLKALKEERERQGISLTELNERTGIDRGSLSKLENDDDPNVTIKTLIRYAEGIGKTVLVELGDT